MGEGRGAAEGQLEGLFQEETTEDHEVVEVAILGLHDHGGFENCVAHEDVVGRTLGGGFGVWRWLLGWRQVVRDKGGLLTEVGNLFGPHGMDQVTFLGVGGLLEERLGSERFLGLVVLFALFEEETFLGGFDDKRGDFCGPKDV